MSRLGGSCSPGSTGPGQHRPSPFTIDAILSEDIGPRRPSSSSPVGENPPCRPPWTPLNDAAALLKTPPTAKNGTMPQPSLPHAPSSYQHTPSRPPHTTPSFITSSPLNTSFILNQSSNALLPPDSLCLDDSNLGILSAVACVHGELSSSSSSGSLIEKVEALRVHSTSGRDNVCLLTQEDLRAQSSLLEPSCASSSMPYILKRDRSRRNKMPPSQQGNTSFPSSLYKTPNKPILKDNTFSPSIFLSHPDVGSNASSLSSSCAATQGHASFDLLTSPHSEAEGSTSGLGKSFVTSTPIRMEENKENVPHTSTSTSSRATAKRKLLDEPSDADVPTRKPRLPYRNSKARTKLSPLLENSCSPISKAEFPPPAHLSLSTPLREHHANGGLSGVPPTSRLSQSLGQPSNGHRAFQSHHHELIIPGGGVGGAVKPLHSSALIQSSPVSSQLNRTGHIQSVPPWYIFPTNKPESKRSRLAEAINRSLTEKTPTQVTSKLPHGWIKLACGQTDDQIRLTEEARSFLCRPRQLAFDNIRPA